MYELPVIKSRFIKKEEEMKRERKERWNDGREKLEERKGLRK